MFKKSSNYFDMWCYTLILIIAVVSAVRLSPTEFECTPEGYQLYKNSESYVNYKGNLYQSNMTELAFIDYCTTIKARVPYVRYQQEYSILADFPSDTIDKLMDQSAIVYSGTGSYYEGSERMQEKYKVSWTTMDRVFDVEDALPYSVPVEEASANAGLPTSWATVTIKAAEQALRNRGLETRLSWRYLYECIYSEENDDSYKTSGVPPKDIMQFIRENGLVAEEDIISSASINCNEKYEHTFHFDVEESEGPNKYSLMNLVVTENPTIVLLAIDFNKAKYVVDMREDTYPITCGYMEPTLYGIVTEYQDSSEEDMQDGFWVVESNIVPGENVALRLPCTFNSTSANYAGIAAFPFSIIYNGPMPTTEPPMEMPTTEAPTTEVPTTEAPTTEAPTTEIPTTQVPENVENVVVTNCTYLGTIMNWEDSEENGYLRSITINLPASEVCPEFTSLDFTKFFWLNKLVINNAAGSLGQLKQVIIGNEKLQTVEISGIDTIPSQLIPDSFLEIKKSVELESINIGMYTFVNYQSFILGENVEENVENFPKLKTLTIGSNQKYSPCYNFMMTDEPFIVENLPVLETVSVGMNAFFTTPYVRFAGLPALQSLTVYSNALYGSASSSQLYMVNIGTEYYSEQSMTSMVVYANAFNSHVNVYLKGSRCS